MNRRIRAAAALALLALRGFAEPATNAPAAKPGPPLWEFGLFGGATRLPHYKGSDEYSLYGVPLPYFIYRGRFVRATREGIQGLLLRGERWETAFSVYGNPPVMGNNSARDGMDDLDPLVEFGPGIKWYFAGRNPARPMYLTAAVRGVTSVDTDGGWGVRHEGLRGILAVSAVQPRLFSRDGWAGGCTFSAEAVDGGYSGYFYDVGAEDARPDRPEYDAPAGYAGFSVAASVTRRLLSNVWLSGYMRWDNLSGAAFEDSPLVRTENNVVASVALVWRIAESRRTGVY